MAKANTVRVYRAEYYEGKLDKWIALYEDTSLERAKTHFGTPIVGNPRQRVASYDKSGVRKPKYSFVEVLERKSEVVK